MATFTCSRCGRESTYRHRESVVPPPRGPLDEPLGEVRWYTCDHCGEQNEIEKHPHEWKPIDQERRGSRQDSPSGQAKLFGEIACLKGYVSPTQLYHALTEQKHAEVAGRVPEKLGAILVRMKAMTEDQVAEVLKTAERR